MFARVSTLSGDPSKMEGMVRQARDTVLPAAKQMAGFKGMLALGNRQTGDVMAVTLWENEQAMSDSEEAANRLRSESAQASGEQIVSVERYEVFIDEKA